MRYLLILACLAALTGCGAASPAPPTETAHIAQTDAGDVAVWRTYQPRGPLVARLAPGTAVTVLRREGEGVLIRTPAGVEGWVSRGFLTP